MGRGAGDGAWYRLIRDSSGGTVGVVMAGVGVTRLGPYDVMIG